MPFAPGAGLGFRAPTLDLEDVASAWREWPFVAARSQASPDTSYAVVPCDRPQLAGFNDPTLTAAGVPLTTTLPGDGIHFERFIVATPGVGDRAGGRRGAARPRDGPRRNGAGDRLGTGRRGGEADRRQVGPGGVAAVLRARVRSGSRRSDAPHALERGGAGPRDGRFSVVLPADRSFRVQPYAFGLPAAPPTSFVVARADVDIGDITLVGVGAAPRHRPTTPGQTTPATMTYAELVVVPIAPVPGKGAAQPVRTVRGLQSDARPAARRLARVQPRDHAATGTFDLLIPPGQYYVYGTRGPFATIDRTPITVAAGDDIPAALVVQSLPILPARRRLAAISTCTAPPATTRRFPTWIG